MCPSQLCSLLNQFSVLGMPWVSQTDVLSELQEEGRQTLRVTRAGSTYRERKRCKVLEKNGNCSPNVFQLERPYIMSI